MMVVDKEKCIGCEMCVKDCFPKDIEMIDGKAHINNITCFKCGHCIAVCPKEAISMDEYDMEEVMDYSKESFSIDPDNLMNFIKFRRTIRQFKNCDVEKEKISKIIEAGRFTETGGNMQDVSYTVLTENLKELRELTLKSLKNIGEYLLKNLTPETMVYKKYAKMWINMYREHNENPESEDRLFFNAPAIIVVTANSQVNGALASSNMELMTNALGLGTVFSGFLVKAANETKEIKDFIQVKEGKEVITCMIVGYPNVKYKRTVPRKKADICWK
ncbi:MAG: nitroreductase family protein [Psychrilyobacter sp.]|uniref:nitroreductase family protein n=1 Tax=Psychrilyobacter sp. TaxID=2586924 RepID=UPI003C776DEA